jgi:hypothetical protein
MTDIGEKTTIIMNDMHPLLSKHQDVEAFLVLHDANNAYIFHEQAFDRPVDYIQYDPKTRQLDFILEGGQTVNFGRPLSKESGKYLENITNLTIAHKDEAKVLDEKTVNVLHPHDHSPKPEKSDYSPSPQKVLGDTYDRIMGKPPFPLHNPLTKEGAKNLALIKEHGTAAIPTRTSRKIAGARNSVETGKYTIA